MKERLLNLYNISKNAILWTIMYWGCTYIIFRLLFNFNIFSIAGWHRIMHASLSGFSGLTFGIVSLALLPIYISTTRIIVRTGKMFFTIPLPRIFKKTPPPAPVATEPQPDPNIIVIADLPTDLPPGMPAEMRAPYLRARRYGAQFPIPKIKPTDPPPASDDATPQMPGELPIPTDFDFDIPPTDTPSFDAPVFSDINFDTPATATDDSTDTGTTNEVEAHLAATGRKFTTHEDLIICDDMVIATHTDPDFWIADDDAWFATGKSRPSPIAALIAATDGTEKRAILYLGATNIMDIDTLRQKWVDAGISVITDLSQI